MGGFQKTGTLIFLTILVLTILSLAVWGLIQIGIRIGSVKTATDIAKGLITHLDLKPRSEGSGEEIGTDEIFTEFTELPRHRYLMKDTIGREIIMEGIGRALADAADSHGFAAGREWNAPKAGECQVIMKREDLSRIAWLADYGLRVWTDPSNDYFRCGEKLTKDEAETASTLLDDFDQKICDLFNGAVAGVVGI